MEVLDMLGKPCPIPVIEAKKLLRAAAPGDVVQVLVDNDISSQNLQKMGEGLGCKVAHEQTAEGNILVSLTAGEARAVIRRDDGFVVAIGRSVMGAGDDELGAMLMKSYIYSLTQLDEAPLTVLFFNGGVHLATEGSACVEDLKALEAKGTVVSSCGACLDFYQKKEQLAVGNVTNMYAMAGAMAGAARLVNL